MATALASTGKHVVTGISRHDSKSQIVDCAKVFKLDYDDEMSLIEALKGQQFLIVTLFRGAPKDTQAKIIKAAAKAGVPWIMPNCYGSDIQNRTLGEENFTGLPILESLNIIEQLGVSSWIAMCCSFWYEHSLSQGESWYGFDFKAKSVTFFDDGNTRINTTTWDQCCRAMTGLLSLKELPEDKNDTSVTLSTWRNQPLYISSFLLSQRNILDSVHHVLGTTDASWTIKQEASRARYERGLELSKQTPIGLAVCLYARTFFPNGDGNYEAKYGLANKALGLPDESVDETTRRAIETVYR